jgi:hypothetical protein
MAHMKHLIEQKLPGVYVRALEITTYDGSIFTGIDLQVSPWGIFSPRHVLVVSLMSCVRASGGNGVQGPRR